jgi:DNA mismatch repair protein MutS
MVEMNETARILNTCTQRSLILLDEIGRGTSTYDGVSIAWSLVEYLHEQANCAARTLFATHYHELSELANRFPRVKNFNVSVKESNGKILFLRKLIPGDSAHSFGIQVAEMAGMPPSVIHRAKTILQQFESRRIDPQNQEGHLKFSPLQELQLNMFELKDEDTLIIRKILAGCDIDQMTPVEALLKLQEIKRELARINQATSNN